MTITQSAPANNPPTQRPQPDPKTVPHRAVDMLRIALSFIFLWPFLDKLLGLGYSTANAKAWISGGSPTNGFLGHVQTGPFQSAFRGIAGATWADYLFMLGLLGIGAALLTGVALRLTAAAGTILLVLMWAAEWPMARFDSTGTPTSSTNPFLDDHLIFAICLVVIATLGTASTWGLGKWWANQPIVQRTPYLR
jgi:thiosulfate dehydrogenase [quinone] large subunit